MARVVMTPNGQRTTADGLLSRLRTTPDAYPQKIDLTRECWLVIELTADIYRAASFLDERILGPTSRGGWLPMERVIEAAREVSEARPLHFILHTGHVGSTLVSRLLDETGAVLPLREPVPLRTLAEIHDDLLKPESLVARSRFDELLDTQLRLWCRGYPGTKCVALKATSSAARLAPEILVRRQDCRAVYMNLRAEPALATLLAGQNSRIDLRGHGPGRMRRLLARVASPLAALHTLSPGELAAMSWLVESLCRRDLLQRFPGQVMGVDFDALLADVRGSLRNVLSHFGLPAADGELDRIASSAVLTQYSKAPEHPYGPAVRATILAEARRDQRDELARGMHWLERLARSEDAVARVLTDSL